MIPFFLSGKLINADEVKYFQRRRRQALVYCVTLATERRLNSCKQRQLKLRQYYEKNDVGKIIYKKFLEVPMAICFALGMYIN